MNIFTNYGVIRNGYTTRITQLTVGPVSEPTFSEQCTHVSIRDEAGGEFVHVEQVGGSTDIGRAVAFTAEEWPMIRDAIDFMASECKEEAE